MYLGIIIVVEGGEGLVVRVVDVASVRRRTRGRSHSILH